VPGVLEEIRKLPQAALLCAITLTGLALFTVGTVIGVRNGRGALRSGTRQLLIGGTAALLVVGIGHLLGASSRGQL
jgi:VIT1/CCC1 family predicted Fe2+/Mn2+ transporter